MSSLRPNVLLMQPYTPGKPISEVQRELGLDRVVKLASNENPLGPSPMAIAAVKQAAESMHIYPDGAAYELRHALAERFDMPESTVMIGNGSDELIHLLGLVFLDCPDDEVIVGDPSFVRYDAAAHLAPAKLIKVALDKDYRHNLPAMAKAVTAKTKLLFIANPNNPTGTVVGKAELISFLKQLPKTVTVVLDEAYFEFAEGLADFPVSTDLIREGYNVIGLRTFSKTYGLAGIRIGYGFAADPIIDAIERAREPFNVNSLAQVAAVAALQDHEHIRRTIEINTRGLERIADALRGIGATPCASHANFVFADLHRPAMPIFQALLRKGVIVRAGDMFGTPTCMRVSVGTDEEVTFFIEKLNQVIQELKKP